MKLNSTLQGENYDLNVKNTQLETLWTKMKNDRDQNDKEFNNLLEEHEQLYDKHNELCKYCEKLRAANKIGVDEDDYHLINEIAVIGEEKA